MRTSKMSAWTFDEHGRIVIHDYARARPFSSFLPGIAGPMGIPMWVFYVNRGQAITSFGVESKDHPVMEFQPANKAYQTTPYTGFRTFIKTGRDHDDQVYEPFSALQRNPSTREQMCIGMNELELQEIDPQRGLQTNVLYFTLPGERFAGLVRRVTLRNLSQRPMDLEVLDGMPAVIPYGVDNWALKEMGRTMEAWMQVDNLAKGIPFYRLRAGVGDTAQVEAIRVGHFALSSVTHAGQTRQLPAFVDPAVIFGHDTALQAPEHFIDSSLAALTQQRQIVSGRTPCAFFGVRVTLSPSEAAEINTVVGHVSGIEKLEGQVPRLLSGTYFEEKWAKARGLALHLTDPVDTNSSSPLFDAYCRQTFLDNVLRGGWPLLLGNGARPRVFHIYSRKHGDPERDYNAFYLAAEYYSQGNGNYRDVNQNRRCDVWFNPQILDFNVRAFMALLQADGYNPLVVEGSRFTLSPEGLDTVLKEVPQSDRLRALLRERFTPGQLLQWIGDHEIALGMSPLAFLSLVIGHAEQHFEADFGAGYWIDHWTYNLDLIDSFLGVFPERKADLLFGRPDLPFYDSPAIVQPRDKKYVLANGQPRQLGAVIRDAEKEALIAARGEAPYLMRTERGHGPVYRTTLFVKLLCLALNKFATLDPWGMGIEMEADRPGWYDALNGLPGLFGSSMPESFELKRLLTFLLSAIEETSAREVSLPVAIWEFLKSVATHLEHFNASRAPQRDFIYWDGVGAARETYRERIRLGFEGPTETIDSQGLARALSSFLVKVDAGIARALELNNGIPPTYFAYQVAEYELIRDADGKPQRDAAQRPYIRAKRFKLSVLPLFLEGPVRALKIASDRATARRLYEYIKASPLFDRNLRMYKVNASLADQPKDIGRARAFPPGWLENESIWLHMEYKYLLEVLKAGLYEEFFQDFKHALIPFQNPQVYGRSPLENSSFIVSSAHADASLHGAGFVARLSGATAEFLSMWNVMMAGERPFFLQNGQLHLALKPILPGWLFDASGTVKFTFLGSCEVVYHNPNKLDTYQDGGLEPHKITLHTVSGQTIELSGGVIGPPESEMVRAGQVETIHISFA